MEITDRTCAFPVPNAKDGGHAPIPRRLHWSFEDLDFSKIDRERIQGRDDMFLLVCSASFMESSSETFTRNLLDYFTGDDEVGTWFTTAWEPEDLQHGRALKAYVQQVWPEFDWDGAYADFFAEYAKLCTTDALEPTRDQEMVVRCIVEMGTTTFSTKRSTPSARSPCCAISPGAFAPTRCSITSTSTGTSCATGSRSIFTEYRSSLPCGAGRLNCVRVMPMLLCAMPQLGSSGVAILPFPFPSRSSRSLR